MRGIYEQVNLNKAQGAQAVNITTCATFSLKVTFRVIGQNVLMANPSY